MTIAREALVRTHSLPKLETMEAKKNRHGLCSGEKYSRLYAEMGICRTACGAVATMCMVTTTISLHLRSHVVRQALLPMGVARKKPHIRGANMSGSEARILRGLAAKNLKLLLGGD